MLLKLIVSPLLYLVTIVISIFARAEDTSVLISFGTLSRVAFHFEILLAQSIADWEYWLAGSNSVVNSSASSILLLVRPFISLNFGKFSQNSLSLRNFWTLRVIVLFSR